MDGSNAAGKRHQTFDAAGRSPVSVFCINRYPQCTASQLAEKLRWFVGRGFSRDVKHLALNRPLALKEAGFLSGHGFSR
jgi:hypothetical protein